MGKTSPHGRWSSPVGKTFNYLYIYEIHYSCKNSYWSIHIANSVCILFLLFMNTVGTIPAVSYGLIGGKQSENHLLGGNQSAVASNKPRLSPRRPVFVSCVKLKVGVVTAIYSCYSNSGCVMFFNACYVMPFHCLLLRSAVSLTVPL